VAAKRTKKQPANPYLNAESPDDLEPANRLAYEIVAERRDLMPSVERIMTAEIDEDARVRAITLFRDSLDQPGDVNRDPRVSIANAG
jgi:hypothetical protein